MEYAARRAERQYDSVDPEDRLIAATLEKRWEEALEELEQGRARLAALGAEGPQPIAIPEELRAAFADAGRRLPELWEQLPIETRKELLRSLMTADTNSPLAWITMEAKPTNEIGYTIEDTE